MKNLSPYCGLVDAKIRASDKDLPVIKMTKSCSILTDSDDTNLIFENPNVYVQARYHGWLC